MGFERRFFVYKANNKLQEIINPRLIKPGGDKEVQDEGCLSIPGYYLPIERYKEVSLKGVDLVGQTISIRAGGLLARVFQHEIDHLDGKLMIDLLDEDQRADFERKWTNEKTNSTRNRSGRKKKR